MKQIYSLFTFIFLFAFSFGAIAQAEFYYEDFDSGLPDGWQAIEVTGNGNASSNWFWTDTGQSGPFAGSGVMASESSTNGWMLFDSDLNCSGEQEAWLISEPIDCSGKSNVTLEIQSYYRRFNDLTSVEVSTDNSNWTSYPIFDGFVNNQGSENPSIDRVVIADVADNQPQVFIAFRFLADATTILAGSKQGCAYWWNLDDFRLYELNVPDGRVNYSFYTPISYAVPVNHLDADEFGYDFPIGVQNIGAVGLENGVATVEVTNDGTGESLYTASIDLPTIAPGTADTFDINPDMNFFPNDLEVGNYSYTLSVDFPGSGEVNLEDNSVSYGFDITSDYFAQENGELTNAIRLDPDQGWKVSAQYFTSPNIQDSIIVSSIITAIQSDSTRLDDNYVRFGIIRNLESDGSFDVDNPDPFNHENFAPAAYDEFFLFTTEQSGDIIEIPVGSKENPVYLRRGAEYSVFAGFDEVQAGGAAIPNNNLRIFVNDELPDAQHLIIYDTDGGIQNVYGGFSNYDFSLLLRLVLQTEASGVDDNPLPEHVFQVSPNPAYDHIKAHINFDDVTNMNLMIINMDGRILSMKDYDAVTQMNKTIDVSDFPNGTYLMKVSTLEGTKTHRFVVQH